MGRTGRALAVVTLVVVPVVGGVAGPAAAAVDTRVEARVEPQAATSAARLPLAGKVVVLDPGHHLGNARHPAQVNRLVDAGGVRKPCNTTGTETAAGYPESAFAMSVARSVRARLVVAGATVYLTRADDSASGWGPCVDVRGRLGNTVHADAVLSIHADGTPSRYHGFFVIRPADRRGWTDDIAWGSGVLASHVRSGLDTTGLPRANYYGGDGLDTRGDLGTLNLSDVPAVMVELGNMKNATDARRMQASSWRERVYAAGLARGLTSYLLR
ncbi:N-acetylmuramoyl-L-alanine amidase [Angustibacter peucedani]